MPVRAAARAASARRAPPVARIPPARPIARVALAALVALAASTALAPRPAAALGLVELHRLALDHDATIAAARDELDAAAFGLPLARSAFRPQLGASAGLFRNRVDSGLGESDFDDSQWQLQLSQSVFNRANAALVEQAGLGVAQARAEFANASQALLLRVADAYFGVLRADSNLSFARSEARAIERQRERAERAFDTGLARITDVRTARAQLDLARAQEILAEDASASARGALRTLAGIDLGGADGPDLDVAAPDLPLRAPEPADIEAWAELAGEQNLDVVVARLAAERTRTQVAVERGARWPGVEIVASAGASDTDRALREGETRSARIGVQATLPLSTGGRIGARVGQARSTLDAALDRYAGARRIAEQDARDGYRGTLAAIARVRALRRALASTRESSEAIESGFRAGTRDSVDVLRALREVFRARSDFAAARYDYVLGSLRLQAAAGTLDEADLAALDGFLVPADALAR